MSAALGNDDYDAGTAEPRWLAVAAVVKYKLI